MLVLSQIFVKVIESWVVLMVIVYEWRWVVIGLPPFFDLLLAINLSSLFLAMALQRSIMSLVDPPRLFYFSVVLEIHLLKNKLISPDSSIKHRGVSNVEMKSCIFQILPSFFSFVLSSFVQWNIYPARKLTLLVPNRLSVPDENNSISPSCWLFF